MVSHDVLTLLSEDVYERSMNSVGKVGVFLRKYKPRAAANLISHVVQGSIGSYRTALLQETLLADDRGDTTRRQPSSTCTDQYRKLFEELSLLQGRLDTVKVGEDSDNGQELVRGVTSRHQRPYNKSEMVTYLSMSDRKAVSKAYAFSSLYVF